LRVGAALIDWLCTVAIAIGAFLVTASTGNVWVVVAFVVLAAAAYEVGLTTWRGQTVGKMALRIVVVDDTDRPPALGRSVVRYVVKTLSPLTVLPVVSILGVVWPFAILVSIATNPYRCGWHDRAGGTSVMEIEGRDRVSTRIATSVPPVELVTVEHPHPRKRRIPPRRR